MALAQLELWALRAAAIAGLFVAVFIKGCSYGNAQTETKYKARDATAAIEQATITAKNRLESTNRQSDVLVAEALKGQAELDLAVYRRAHPLSGIFDRGVHTPEVCHPTGSGQGAGDEATLASGKASGVLQPQGAGDRGDQLDALLAEADAENEDYRVCLSTRPAPRLP